jgi:hypothetical protein
MLLPCRLKKGNLYPDCFTYTPSDGFNYEFSHPGVIESRNHKLMSNASLESGFGREVGAIFEAVRNSYQSNARAYFD